MPHPPRPPSRLTDVLSTVLKRVDPEQHMRAHKIWGMWNEVVGATIARRAQPARFRNGILFVTVATHGWMQELQFMKDDIRERVNARLGTALVRDIFLATGQIESPQPSPPPERIVPSTGAPVVDLPDIPDPELSAAFARLVGARARRIARATPRPPAKTGGARSSRKR